MVDGERVRSTHFIKEKKAKYQFKKIYKNEISNPLENVSLTPTQEHLHTL